MKIINLLPKPKQNEFYYRRLYHNLLVLFGVAGVTFVFVGIALFASRLFLEHNLRASQENIERIKAVSNKEENAELKRRIQEINNQIGDYNSLAASAPKWANVLRQFTRLVPERVYIQNFTVDATKRQATINGFAPSRDSVIALYNNIRQDTEHFQDIDYPLENVSRPTNVTFHFTFTVAEGVLK